MTHPILPNTARQSTRFRSIALALVLFSGASSYAIDFGPEGMFSLTGFAKSEVRRGSNNCNECQLYPLENKQRIWADDLVVGKPYGTSNSNVTLFQPWLGVKYDLGQGYKLNGLLSQRWRDGKHDIPGFWYEKNIAISHDDYGSLRVGAMTTRTWSIADYPYGTNIGVANVWGASGAGYGLLTNAVRYTSRKFDVAQGDLVVEASYDQGNRDFKINKPKFLELYAQYYKGDLVIDAMFQDTRNGNPQAWSQGPFTSLTPHAADDPKLGGSGQSIAMVMGRYQLDSRIELSGGIRINRWSGAYAVITVPGTQAQWNNMFNVDWNGQLNGVPNPGYAARTVDTMLGARYRMGQWTAHTGLTYLGKANTSNPSERGQSNAALINTLGLGYEVRQGFQVYGFVGIVNYARIGLAPMSMPSNTAFTNVDSRVTRTGNWAGLGAVYVF
jgi:predicted porin